jgi:hypothetical protein
MQISFIFIGEGSSDAGLVPLLEEICICSGADEVRGVAPDFARLSSKIGHSVEAKLKAALRLEPNANLVFMHRDADSKNYLERYNEIAAAVNDAGCTKAYVAVVPVRETEAWLLLDELAIRQVVGRPLGTAPLDLPRPAKVESIADPKEKLQALLLLASEASGRKLQKVAGDFPLHRLALLQQLTMSGPQKNIHSWKRMIKDSVSAVEKVRKLAD